jgi:cell division protein FtsI (penicillin-binding protein 3)
MTGDKKILNRIYLIAIPMFVMAIAVFVKLLFIQYSEGPTLRAQAENEVIKEIKVQADRGNIYSSDGKLLATSMPVYNLYFDPLTVDAEVFSDSLSRLSSGLARFFPQKTSTQWLNHLKERRAAGSRYVYLGEDVSFTNLQRIKQLPIFNLGRFKGGLIYEQQNYRKMPLGKIAERTIGYDKLRAKTGIEGAFSNYLSGRDGVRLKQKVSNGNWKPLKDHYEIEPEDGLDVITTIDSRIQDIAHHELLAALERFEADHGCIVVMEVATGAIKAIANLGRTEQGTYFEKRNYAVWESTEPGSTFKLASVIVALEDGVADTNTLIDTQNGIWELYGTKVKDSNYKNGQGGYGTITLKRAFELSSNVGIVKMIYENYRHDESKFVDHLYNMGLNRKLGLSILGEGTPIIPNTSDARWSGITLPWMSFGYTVSLTPLQLLSLYNAVANDGTLVKPRFVESVKKHGLVVEENPVTVLNPAICSKETLAKVQDMLVGVVENGTAQNLKNSIVPLAGKTGTCQTNYWVKAKADYQASFAGYFPADNPKYSCIVVINEPNYHYGYYGSTVAAPVFKAVAENIYLGTPTEVNTAYKGNSLASQERTLPIDFSKLPNLKGLNGAEVISALENKGIKVLVQGNGKVSWQYPAAGTPINQLTTVEIKLI